MYILGVLPTAARVLVIARYRVTSSWLKSTRILFQALVYRDGNLVSGSLEALVQHMVPTEDYYPDRAYLFAFLLSARLFIKPHELLGEVCALCEHQQNLNGEGGKVSIHTPLSSSSRSVCAVLSERHPKLMWLLISRDGHEERLSCIIVSSHTIPAPPSSDRARFPLSFIIAFADRHFLSIFE